MLLMNYYCMKSLRFLSFVLLAFAYVGGSGQTLQQTKPDSRLNIGLDAGIRANFMRYSDLNKDIFPSRNATLGGVFGLFVEYEFGNNLQFAVRPELDYTRRGGKLSDIKNNLIGTIVGGDSYRVTANYWDFRVPVMYQFLEAEGKIRPYVFVAPAFGITMSGNVQLKGVGQNGAESTYKVEASGANIAKTNFALTFGAGAKYYFPIASTKAYVGFEISYECGLTDTYSGDEKNGIAAVNKAMFGSNYVVNGSRKFSGLEFRVTFGIPLRNYGKKKSSPMPVLVEEPIHEEKTADAEERRTIANCCTLDDIIDMMARGEAVEGKTICAVDDIHFDFNKSDIREESFSYLDKLASTLIRMNANVEVKGHTDNIGSDEVNMKISRQRAKAVMDYLIEQGVNPGKISYSYYGATNPLVSNDTLEGRRINRRVEIEILK